jgi:hypothetical protein
MNTITEYQGQQVRVLARDTDPTCLVWICFVNDPDRDAFVSPEALSVKVVA